MSKLNPVRAQFFRAVSHREWTRGKITGIDFVQELHNRLTPLHSVDIVFAAIACHVVHSNRNIRKFNSVDEANAFYDTKRSRTYFKRSRSLILNHINKELGTSYTARTVSQWLTRPEQVPNAVWAQCYLLVIEALTGISKKGNTSTLLFALVPNYSPSALRDFQEAPIFSAVDNIEEEYPEFFYDDGYDVMTDEEYEEWIKDA